MFGFRALLVATLLPLALGCSNVSPDTSMEDGPDSGPVAPPEQTPVGFSMLVHTRDALYKVVDDQSFDLAFIGAFEADESITDLAVTPDGRVFGVSAESLYQIDPRTGKATWTADVPGELNVGLTFLPNGQLLATDKLGSVREISPDTGEVTEIGKFGNGWGTAGDLVAVADGTMFAIGEYQNEQDGDSDLLLTVNTGTGEASYIGELGFGDVFGTAYTNGRVYAFTSTGQIIQINPTTGIGVLVRTHTDVAFWGAAVTPLIAVE